MPKPTYAEPNWDTIPNDKMTPGLQMYLATGRLPGDFLQALLRNSLTDFFARADETNRALVQEWCWWMHGEFPGKAWGSAETVKAWTKQFREGDDA